MAPKDGRVARPERRWGRHSRGTPAAGSRQLSVATLAAASDDPMVQHQWKKLPTNTVEEKMFI